MDINLKEDQLKAITDMKCHPISCYLDTVILVLGLLSNITFLVIILTKNEEKTFKSTMPLRHLLVGMLIGDLTFLLSNLNSNMIAAIEFPDLTSYNIICQLTSYLINYFAVLTECFMLAADFILLFILFKPKPARLNVYTSFIDLSKTNVKRLSSIRIRAAAPQVRETWRFSKLFAKKHTVLIKSAYDKKNIYSSIVTTEKFCILVFGLACLYLLSFILWTRGVRSFDLMDRKYHNESLIFYDDFVSNICKTYAFADKFFWLYQIVFHVFRLITLLVNIAVAVIYCVKFRGEYLRILLNTFKRNENDLPHSKTIRLKSFDINYSTQLSIIYHENKRAAAALTSNETTRHNNLQLHYNHLLFINHYALFVLVYSVIMLPIVCIKLYVLNATPKLNIVDQSKQIDLASSDLEFLLNEVVTNDTMLFSKFFYEDDESSEASSKLLNDLEQANLGDNSLLNILLKVAYSCKLFVYLIFSSHLKLSIKTRLNPNYSV